MVSTEWLIETPKLGRGEYSVPDVGLLRDHDGASNRSDEAPTAAERHRSSLAVEPDARPSGRRAGGPELGDLGAGLGGDPGDCNGAMAKKERP